MARKNDSKKKLKPLPIMSSLNDELHESLKRGEMRPGYYAAGQVHEVKNCLLAWGLKGNAYLYQTIVMIARAGKKNPTTYIEDLEKAKTWLQFEIDEAKANAAGLGQLK